jgi:hypothetical protein
VINKAVPLFLVFFAWPLAAAATTPEPASPPSVPGHEPAEEAQILAVLDAYMLEISANDLAAMQARQTPEGMTYRHLARADGSWEVRPRSNMDWVAPERATKETYRERYWTPTVLIRGPMALVWTPYEFQIDGQTSHCGIDVFSFSKIDGVWKVSNAMWTVEPEACTELGRPGPVALRPQVAAAPELRSAVNEPTGETGK